MDLIPMAPRGRMSQQNQQKYHIRDYKPTKLWYERKEIIQNIGEHTPKENIDRKLVEKLKEISIKDPHLDVRAMARELVDSFKYAHDFSRAPTLVRLKESQGKK